MKLQLYSIDISVGQLEKALNLPEGVRIVNVAERPGGVRFKICSNFKVPYEKKVNAETLSAIGDWFRLEGE